MDIRVIANNDLAEAVKLVADVFMEYEAPDYSQEGIQTFFDTALYNADFMNSLTVYGAYADESIVGVLATRDNGRHIALFFVSGAYHRQGIGRCLFRAALENCNSQEMTVNSSPYAREVYHHLGFADTDAEQIVTGIHFIPMRYSSKPV